MLYEPGLIEPICEWCSLKELESQDAKKDASLSKRQMSTLVYKAKYRPVRLGWCVSGGDMKALTRAFSLGELDAG